MVSARQRFAERLAHEIMAGIRGESQCLSDISSMMEFIFSLHFLYRCLALKVCLLKLNEMDAEKQIFNDDGRLVWQTRQGGRTFLLPVK